MYGQYRNSGIVRLRTYTQALDWFEKTTPIRGKGRNAGVRPLGHRNRPWFQILKVGDAIACRLYNTDVVTFHPDNTIVLKTDGYTSQTTANFIRDVLPFGASVFDNAIVVSVHGDGHYRLKKELVVKLKEDGRNYEVLNYEKSYTYTIDRKKMNRLRKESKAFRTYAVGLTKLVEGMFEKDTEEVIPALVPNYWGGATPEILTQAVPKFVLSEDDGNWHALVRQLAFSGWHWSDRVRVTPEAVSKRLDTAMMCAAPDVFVINEVPKGQVKRNRYAKFVPYVTGGGA